MWRWLHSLPRALRNQTCGPRASAGLCVEEEQACKENVSTGEEECVKKETRRRGRQCWRKHFISVQGGQKKDGSGKDNHSEKSTFWNLSNAPLTGLDVMGWGGFFIVSLQFSKFKQFLDSRYSGTDNAIYLHNIYDILYKVARALPKGDIPGILQYMGPTGTTEKQKPETKQTSEPEEKQPPEPCELEKAFAEFDDQCNLYSGVENNLMGLHKYQQGHIEGAVTHWREASSCGYAKAQFNLGLCFETGQGVNKCYDTAVKYYKMSASYDHPQALYNLALIYMDGLEGVFQDSDQAIELLERSAGQGLSQAQLYLGVYYMEEEHLDLKKAAGYFTSAAEQDNIDGQYYLAVCYENGMGVEENLCKAAHLYSKAAGRGHQDATHNLALFYFYGLGGIPVNITYAEELLQKCNGLESVEAGIQPERGQQGHTIDQSEDCTAAEVDTAANKGQQMSVLLPLKSAASSPSLTEFVRENISKLGLTIPSSVNTPFDSDSTESHSKIDTSRNGRVTSLSLNTLSWEPRHDDHMTDKMADSSVMFYLESDGEDSGFDVNSQTPQLNFKSNCSSLIYHRNNTMPDLLAVSCT